MTSSRGAEFDHHWACRCPNTQLSWAVGLSQQIWTAQRHSKAHQLQGYYESTGIGHMAKLHKFLIFPFTIKDFEQVLIRFSFPQMTKKITQNIARLLSVNNLMRTVAMIMTFEVLRWDTAIHSGIYCILLSGAFSTIICGWTRSQQWGKTLHM